MVNLTPTGISPCVPIGHSHTTSTSVASTTTLFWCSAKLRGARGTTAKLGLSQCLIVSHDLHHDAYGLHPLIIFGIPLYFTCFELTFSTPRRWFPPPWLTAPLKFHCRKLDVILRSTFPCTIGASTPLKARLARVPIHILIGRWNVVLSYTTSSGSRSALLTSSSVSVRSTPSSRSACSRATFSCGR